MSINLGIPQFIMILIFTLNLCISLMKHGETKKGNESFGLSVIGNAILFAILWWGGFFK